MDAWTESQRNMIAKGGNSRAKQFFDTYGLNNMTTRDKYNTKAALYYRSRLRAEVTGDSFTTQPPSVEEGALPLISPGATPTPSASTMPGPSARMPSQMYGGAGGGMGGGSNMNLGAPDSFAPPQSQQTGGISSWFGGGGNGAAAPGASSWTEYGLMTLGSIYSKAQETATAAAQVVQEKGVVDSVKTAATASASWVGETSRNVATTISQDEFWKNAQETVLRTAGTATEALGKGMVIASDWVSQQVEGGGPEPPSGKLPGAKLSPSGATIDTINTGSRGGSYESTQQQQSQTAVQPATSYEPRHVSPPQPGIMTGANPAASGQLNGGAPPPPTTGSSTANPNMLSQHLL